MNKGPIRKGKDPYSHSYISEISYISEAEKGAKIQCLWIDRGGEFNSNKFTSFCVSHGIKK